jgi:iron complex transport system ATP-binding protein
MADRAEKQVQSPPPVPGSAAAPSGEAAPVVFQVEHLSFAYTDSDRLLFDDLSLTVASGKITALIGANGSGKSTLFQIMTKNLRPRAGNVLLYGKDIARYRLRDFAREVAAVHQRNTAPYDISVQQLVAYGRLPWRQHLHPKDGEDEQAVSDALAFCDLTSLQSRRVSELSGGQQQRVWIALALAQKTRVILLDEPTTYLDIQYQLMVLNLIKNLNHKLAMTVFMISHDINQALNISDELIALGRHGLVMQGAARDMANGELLSEIYHTRLTVHEVDQQQVILTGLNRG